MKIQGLIKGVALMGIVVAVLILTATALLYLPAVQKRAQEEAILFAREKLDLDIRLNHFSVRFPARIALEQVVVIQPPSDTLLSADELTVRVALWPLIAAKSVKVNAIGLKDARAKLLNRSSGFGLDLRVARLSASDSRLSLRDGSVNLGNLIVDKLRFEASIGQAEPDSTETDSPEEGPDFLKTIIFNHLEIRQSEGFYHDLTSETGFQFTLSYANLEKGAYLSDSLQVAFKEMDVRNSHFAIQLPVRSPDSTPANQSTGESTADSAGQWNIRVGKVRFRDNSIYLNRATPLRMENIRLVGENLHYTAQGSGGVIADFSFSEEHGFVLQKLSGAIQYNSDGVTVDNLLMKSNESYADLHLSFPLKTPPDSTDIPFWGNVDMQIAFADLARFMALPLPADSLRGKKGKFSLQAAWEGSRNLPILKQLHFDWPGLLKADADGSLSLPEEAKTPLRQLTGSLRLKADFKKGAWSEWIMQLAKIDSGAPIPPSLTLQASADGFRGKFLFDLQASLPEGKTTLTGSAEPEQKRFDLRLNVDSVEMQQLFPKSHVGLLSAQLQMQLEARNKKPADWSVTSGGQIGPLVWNGHPLQGVRLDGFLQEGNYLFKGESLDSTAQASWHITGTLSDSLQTLAARLETRQLSFNRLGLSPANLVLNSPFDVSISATLRKTTLLLRSSDLSLSASADTSMRAIAHQFSLIADSLAGWWQGNNPLPLQFVAPLRFAFSAQTNNPLAHYFRPDSIVWKQIVIQGSTTHPTGFNGSGLINGLSVQGIPIDSAYVQFGASDAIHFNLRVATLPGNRDYFSRVGLSGSLTPGTLSTRFLLVDKKEIPQFQLSTLTHASDSVITSRISNTEPIIGGEVCSVNPDNHISWHTSGRLSGNLLLTGKALRVNFHNEQPDSAGISALTLQITGLQLQNLLSFVPGMEKFSAEMGIDGRFASTSDGWESEGLLNLKGVRYGNLPIGDVGIQTTLRRNTQMVNHIKSSLQINKQEALRAEGWYRPQIPDSALQLALTLTALPLSVANPFMAKYATLDGYLQGNLLLAGNTQMPMIEGAVRFHEAKLHLVPTLANYTLSSDTLTLKNRLLSVASIRLIDANGKSLTLKGSVSLTETSTLNMLVEGKNIQLLNVPQTQRNAVATGRAFADISARIGGTLTAPVVNSTLHLLRGTRVNYYMKESLEPENHQEIVQFIALNDTARIRQLYSRPPVTYQGGLDITTELKVENDANFSLFFAGEGGNRATIQGGGSLYYHLSPQSMASLTGTYTLAGGTIEYKPFVNASIAKNSTVTWTGIPGNPELNLSAVKMVRANVEQQDRLARPVSFQVILRMQNYLQRPTVTFDVLAPADLAIQNQLATATPEEKQRQAVSLLVYGTYDLSGASTQPNEANSALNAFMESQLNKLARQTVKGVDLTFGVDSHAGAGGETTGQQGTDYSYNLSKSFLNNRASLRVGGKVSTYDNPWEQGRDNLIDDISLEYVLNERGTRFLRLFRQVNYENLLEGEIIETGVSLMHRQQYNRFSDIFRRRKKQESIPSNPSNSSKRDE